jgi:hypothetical protein
MMQKRLPQCRHADVIHGQGPAHEHERSPAHVPREAYRLRTLWRGFRLRCRRAGRRLLVLQRKRPSADADRQRRGLSLPRMPARGSGRKDAAMKRLLAVLLVVGALAVPMAARAAAISILGKWEIVEATPAPWSQPRERTALEAQGKRVLGSLVTFSQGGIESKFKPFNCKRHVLYEPNSLEVDALFQGNLPEPNPMAAAARLGFPRGDIPGVDVRCLKALFTFHFRDPNTALINLDRVIYTLKRQ